MKKEYLKKLLDQRVLESKVYQPPTNRKNSVKLDLNESYFFLDQKILKELKKFDYFTLSSYPEYEELTKKISKYSNCKTEEILLTNGSDHAIQMLLNLFFHEGDEVVIPSPTFFVYF